MTETTFILYSLQVCFQLLFVMYYMEYQEGPLGKKYNFS